MLMSSRDATAILQYQPNGYRIVRSGRHVFCAVSGREIPLDTLTYWSVERQEAYATPDLATQRLLEPV